MENISYSDDMFDLYSTSLSEEIKKELNDSVCEYIKKITSENEIELPKLNMKIVNNIPLRKQDIELNEKGLLKLKPKL
jgi:hypothetical protein